jgi:hypothetical protein
MMAQPIMIAGFVCCMQPAAVIREEQEMPWTVAIGRWNWLKSGVESEALLS